MNRNVLAFVVLLSVFFIGCGKANVVNVYEESTENGIVATYYEMSNGTWKCNDKIYKYRLELTGRTPNAVRDSQYAVLTNNDSLAFDEVSKSLYSSLIEDSEVMKDSVIVEMK